MNGDVQVEHAASPRCSSPTDAEGDRPSRLVTLAATRRSPRTTARARSPQTATFFNNRVLPQGDISFAEFMPAEIQKFLGLSEP